MCEVAAHLTDHVLPHVPARQWVLSVPKRLRPYLHHGVRVAGAVLQISTFSPDCADRRLGGCGHEGAGKNEEKSRNRDPWHCRAYLKRGDTGTSAPIV